MDRGISICGQLPIPGRKGLESRVLSETSTEGLFIQGLYLLSHGFPDLFAREMRVKFNHFSSGLSSDLWCLHPPISIMLSFDSGKLGSEFLSQFSVVKSGIKQGLPFFIERGCESGF